MLCCAAEASVFAREKTLRVPTQESNQDDDGYSHTPLLVRGVFLALVKAEEHRFKSFGFRRIKNRHNIERWSRPGDGVPIVYLSGVNFGTLFNLHALKQLPTNRPLHFICAPEFSEVFCKSSSGRSIENIVDSVADSIVDLKSADFVAQSLGTCLLIGLMRKGRQGSCNKTATCRRVVLISPVCFLEQFDFAIELLQNYKTKSPNNVGLSERLVWMLSNRLVFGRTSVINVARMTNMDDRSSFLLNNTDKSKDQVLVIQGSKDWLPKLSKEVRDRYRVEVPPGWGHSGFQYGKGDDPTWGVLRSFLECS